MIDREGVADFAEVVPVGMGVAVPAAFLRSVTVNCQEQWQVVFVYSFYSVLEEDVLRGKRRDWRDYSQVAGTSTWKNAGLGIVLLRNVF